MIVETSGRSVSAGTSTRYAYVSSSCRASSFSTSALARVSSVRTMIVSVTRRA